MRKKKRNSLENEDSPDLNGIRAYLDSLSIPDLRFLQLVVEHKEIQNIIKEILKERKQL